MVNLSLTKALFEIQEYADMKISVRTHLERQWNLLMKVSNIFPKLRRLFARHATYLIQNSLEPE